MIRNIVTVKQMLSLGPVARVWFILRPITSCSTNRGPLRQYSCVRFQTSFTVVFKAYQIVNLQHIWSNKPHIPCLPCYPAQRTNRHPFPWWTGKMNWHPPSWPLMKFPSPSRGESGPDVAVQIWQIGIFWNLSAHPQLTCQPQNQHARCRNIRSSKSSS